MTKHWLVFVATFMDHPLGAEFQLMFHLLQGQFQVLMEDVMALDNPFYINNSNQNHHLGASIETKLLMPLKCLAHSIPSHCFMDFFCLQQCVLK
jgi:hypothetical protein